MLGIDDLARQTREDREQLLEWRDKGLLGARSKTEFGQEDVERAGLVRLCLERGFPLDAVARAERDNGTITRAAVSLSAPGRKCTIAEAAAEADMEPEFARRLWSVITGGDDEMLSSHDVEAMQALKTFRSVGFPEEALVEGTRVLSDSLTRVGEMLVRLFHIHMHERLKAAGVSGTELMSTVAALGDQSRPLLEPTILYFHRRGWERAVKQDMLEHLAEDVGLAPPSELPGQLHRAVMFSDLSGFTPLTASMGDETAARVLDRFSGLVRTAVARHDGHIVSQIGDAFFVVFDEPGLAVKCALEIERTTANEPDFPAVRSGIHSGSVLYREGSYVGTTVNIASRVAAEADRHEVVVTANVYKGAAGMDAVRFTPLGERRLKGVADPIELFQARA